MWLAESERFLETLREAVERDASADPFLREAVGNLIYLAEARHEWLGALARRAEAAPGTSEPPRDVSA
jgi:hypothetical protein